MRDLERLDSSIPGVGERDGERCRRVEEIMPVSSAQGGESAELYIG